MSVLVAVALDRWLGEPPSPVHPVVIMGRFLEVVGGRLPAAPPGRARRGGTWAWALGAVAVAASAIGIERWLRRLSPGVGSALRGLFLWPLLSLRMLHEEVAAVESALGRGVAEGRRQVSRIVGRPTEDLDEAAVREAALESLAENLSDGLVAPLTWYCAGGLPAAAVYRYVNTADAMWGYRDLPWRDAGRTAARADDAANLLPARLTAALLVSPREWGAVRDDAARTSSPNAGWPMAALGHRLGVRLGKAGCYRLNDSARPPDPSDTERALRLTLRVGLAAAGMAAALRWS